MIVYITNQVKIQEYFPFELGTIHDVMEFCENHSILECDTETTGFDPYTCKLLTLQLGNEDVQYVIDCSTVDISVLKPYFEDKKKTFIFQNAKFDLRFLYHQNIWVANVYDTYLVEVLLHKGLPYTKKSLDALALKYAGIVLDKSIRGDINRYGLTNEVIEYAAKDVCALSIIRREQLKICEEKDIMPDVGLQNEFVRALAYVEYSGFYLDREKWVKKCEKDIKELHDISVKLDSLLIEEFPQYQQKQLDLFADTTNTSTVNWKSAKQLIPIFQQLGVDTKVEDKKTGKIKHSVDSKILKKYKGTHPLIDTFLKYSKVNKKVTTFGYNVLKQINKVTGRIHTNYNQIVDTGRMSCGGKEHINMQQIPGDSGERECFTNQFPNTLLTVADYSGMETIMLAHYAQDPEFTDYLTHPEKDLHSLFTSYLFEECEGLPHPVIKKQYPHLRRKAKGGTFAWQFGGNGLTMHQNLSISIDRCEKTYNGVMNTFPNLAVYWRKEKEATLKRGYILVDPVTKAKRFLPFWQEYKDLEAEIKAPGFWTNYRMHKEMETDEFVNVLKPKVSRYFSLKGDMERKALNTPIQGTCSAIMKLAVLWFFIWIISNKLQNRVKICGIVHDEVIIEATLDLIDESGTQLQKCMEGASLKFSSIKMIASPVKGHHWDH